MEDVPRVDLCAIKQEENVSVVKVPKLKKEAAKAKQFKLARETRRSIGIKPCHQRTKEKKSMKLGYTKT